MHTISAADSVFPAIRRTREFLFRPFVWGTYLKLGLVAIVTEGLGETPGPRRTLVNRRDMDLPVFRRSTFRRDASRRLLRRGCSRLFCQFLCSISSRGCGLPSFIA